MALLSLQFQLSETLAQDTLARYIFIGHCYQAQTAGDKVDYRIEQFDFSDFNGIWLGGDVCVEAMLDYSTVRRQHF